MNYLKPAMNRFLSISIALIVQVALLVSMSRYFSDLSEEINAAIRILSIFLVLFIINERCNPAIKLAWIVFIFVTPVFGGMVYILLGGKRPRRFLKRALELSEEKHRKYRGGSKEAADRLKCESEALHSQSRYLENLGFPVCEKSSAEYYSLGDDAFPEMIKELKKAKEFIFMEYFIIDDGRMLSEIVDILEQKVKEGVEVRFMYDDMGSVFTVPKTYLKELAGKGIKCHAFNPYLPIISAAMNNRDHRKITVIDNRVAFTGGINIADEYINEKEKFGHWKDNAVKIEGRAAREFTLMFLDLWHGFCDKDEDIERFLKNTDDVVCEGYVQPFSDTPLDDEKTGENVYLNAINGANRYIYIYTPYLIPDYELNSALCLASKRGVEVRLIVPGIPDKKIVYSMTKSYYATLIKAGVKIYKYPKGFVHAKGFVADDNIACAGTINLDFRSMAHHFECGCVFYNHPIVKSIRADMEQTLEECELVKKYQKFEGFIGSTYHAVLRLLAPLM